VYKGIHHCAFMHFCLHTCVLKSRVVRQSSSRVIVTLYRDGRNLKPIRDVFSLTVFWFARRPILHLPHWLVADLPEALQGFSTQEFHYIHVIRTLAYKNFFKCFVAGLDTIFGAEIEFCITALSPYGVFKTPRHISGHYYSELEPRIV